MWQAKGIWERVASVWERVGRDRPGCGQAKGGGAWQGYRKGVGHDKASGVEKGWGLPGCGQVGQGPRAGFWQVWGTTGCGQVQSKSVKRSGERRVLENKL